MTRSSRPTADAGKTAVPPFDYGLDFATIDFRAHPELYRIGKREQGVLLVEPCKSELLPHWRFLTPEQSRASADAIHGMLLAYKARGDFVGVDMARKTEHFSYGSATLRWRRLVRGLDARGPSSAPWKPPVSSIA